MAFVGDAVAFVSTTLFFFLGGYVGVVSAFFWGGLDFLYTMVAGFVRVPFIFADRLASIYNGEHPLGASPALARRKKKLAARPLFDASSASAAAAVNAPAGAPEQTYDYGGFPRQAMAPPSSSRIL